MNALNIILNPDLLHQRQVINLNVQGKAKRVVFETKHFDITDKWYVSIFDAQSGQPLCTFVPLIASYDMMINLLEPFAHKRIGWLFCVPVVDEPSSEFPRRNNLGEFTLFWGDELE